jgi:hypothetical protein
MKTYIVLGVLVLFACVLLLMDPVKEGFQSVIVSGIQCPPGYRFFNDKSGNSLCCKGRVNPYTNQCEGAHMCAFSPHIQDPKSPGTSLPLCAEAIQRSFAGEARVNCTPSLPHFATDGVNSKCCANSAVENGRTCSAENMGDPTKYCVVAGAKQAHERSCSEVKVGELSECPSGFKKTTHTLGERETTHYNVPAVKGTTVPVCTNFTDSCMPDTVLQHLKTRGVFTNKDPQSWKYACPAWIRKYETRDDSFEMDSTYP